ncbi:MAG: ROK family protein, partial [Planctomycetes bacterium]|nr:ROK family protein [Planctomycetota bacterium]
ATALAAAEPSRGAAPAFQQLADVGAAAALGDAAAIAAIEYGARALGTGIANLVMAFNPHRISLMGGVLGLGDAWFDAVVDEARRRSFPRAAAVLDIDRCRLGEITGAFGAAMLSQEALQR